MRTADIGKLKFSSFDDLVGHDVAVRGPVPGLFEQPIVSPELWKFLREHHNIGRNERPRREPPHAGSRPRRLRGREPLTAGCVNIARMGLSGKIEPLLSRSVIEDGDVYVCFSKARVSPSFVDAFSRALKQFKQTEAFQAIYRKYFP